LIILYCLNFSILNNEVAGNYISLLLIPIVYDVSESENFVYT